MMFPKASHFKSKKLRDSARGRPCMFCGIVDDTVVAAHCNEGEHRGMGLKAPDSLIAYLCHRCHDRVDGRCGSLSLEEKREE
ncbi:MAG: nuclease domain-containing protein [Betaproteobacteria bacterium]